MPPPPPRPPSFPPPQQQQQQPFPPSQPQPVPPPRRELHPETLAVTAGRPTAQGSAFNVPPTFASAYRDGGDIGYGRWTNPTWEAFEETLAALEGGGAALAFASGQAAVAAVLDSLPIGARVVAPVDAYLATRGLLADAAARGTLDPVLVDATDSVAVGAAIVGADLLWLESPLNPLLGIVDFAAVCGAAAVRGVPVVVDNTFATPILQQPLNYGATMVVHSATKYLGGHSDLLLGAVVTRDADLADRLHQHRTQHGAVPGAMEAWLALRGMRTLPLRVERASASARLLAEALATHPGVASVRYPGLPSHPQYGLAVRQMRGPGAMLCIDVGDQAHAEAVVGALELVVPGTSLGGVETTVERRARWAGEEHVPPGLLRMSVGLEYPGDLFTDLDQALNQAAAFR